jgi:AraC-like DNA-binding protein
MFYQFNHLGSPDYLKLEKGENFSFQPHLHQCFEIIIILSGEMQITVDHKEFSLCKNEALLIFPNQIHSLRSDKSEHMLCIFSPKLVQAFSSKLMGKIPVNNKFIPDEYLVNALSRLSPQSKTSERKGVLYSLCSQFEKNAEYAHKQTDKKDLLYKIFSFVEDNYKKECSLAELALNTGYDYSYLSRYFKKTVGISFNAYVNHSRLSHTCYLMENSNMPIIQCAYESGFTSLRSFNRNFKAYYSVTPAEYKKRFRDHN